MNIIEEELGLNPNFEKALKAALKCFEDAIKELEDSQNDDLKKLAKFTRYAKEFGFKYRNFLELMNINENSISQIFHWLLDINKAIEIYGTEEYKNSIQYIFTSEFLKRTNKKKNILTGIEYTINNCTCKFNNIFKIDILIEAQFKDTNNNVYNYVYVIENKKNAPLSCTKSGESEKYKTQLEIYHDKVYTCKKYSGYEKVFIFMCSKKNLYLNDFVCQHVKPKEAENNLTIKGQAAYTENIIINQLLSILGYYPIEHGELAIILYTSLKEYIFKLNKNKDDYFEKGILKSAKYNIDTLYSYILDQVLKMCNEKCKSAIKISNFIKNKEIKDKLEKQRVISFSQHINIEYKKLNNGKSPRIGQMPIDFYTSLLKLQQDNTNDDFILELLCRFVEYLELHYDFGNFNDNVIGNTKIIDGKYIEDVCYDIFINKRVFENLDVSLQNLIKEMIRYRLFIELIKNIDKNKIEIGNTCILSGKYGFERSSQNFEIRFIPGDCKNKLKYIPNYESKQNQPIFYISIETTWDIETPIIHFCLALAPCNNTNIKDVKNKEILFNIIQSVLNDSQKYNGRKKSGCERWHTFDKEHFYCFNFETNFSQILNFDETKNVINNLIKEYEIIIEKFNETKNLMK